jgi:hypothetical protein
LRSGNLLNSHAACLAAFIILWNCDAFPNIDSRTRQSMNRCINNCSCSDYAASVFNCDKCRVAKVAGVYVTGVIAFQD